MIKDYYSNSSASDEHSDSWGISIESLLCPDCVKTLLDQVKTNIDNSCKTIEDCDRMAEKVKDEAAKFNKCLDTMAEAAKGFQAGTVTKDELAATCNPCLAELRASCDVLKFDKCCDDSQDVTDEDIANLRAFIIGVHDMVAKKRSELVSPTAVPTSSTSKDGPDANECKTTESFIFVGPANENELTFVLRQKFGFDSKLAKATVKEGKQHLKAKEFNEAVACFKKAKSMYSSALTKCKNMPDKIKTAKYLTNNHDLTGRKTGESYKEASFTKTAAMNSFSKKIGEMDELIDKAMQQKRALTAKAAESFIDIEAELGLAAPVEEEYEEIDIEAELGLGNDPEVQDTSDDSNVDIDIEAELGISNALEEELDTSSDDDPELDEDLDDAVGEPESNDHNDEDPNAATKEILD